MRTIREHFADRLFLSVTGVTHDGMLTDIDVLEAEVKRAMLEQAEESVLLLDGSKLAAHGRQAIAPLARGLARARRRARRRRRRAPAGGRCDGACHAGPREGEAMVSAVVLRGVSGGR